MDREIKSFHTMATKVVDADQGIVEHYVAVMGNIDRQGDVLHPGAFSKSIQERGLKVRVLDQHNSASVRNIVGRPLALKEIGRLEMPPELLEQYPNATGALLATTQFLLDTPEGRGVFDRIKAGAADEYSIGYDPIVTDYSTLDTPEGKKTVRNLREVRLWEYSPVVFAANPAAVTLSAKEAGDGPAEEKPKPQAGESESDWMGRCVPVRMAEGEERDQAVAVCLSMYREKGADGGEVDDDGTDEDDEKRRRRRRRMPAAGTGVPGAVVVLDPKEGDDPDEEKAGRRLRRDRIDQARQACKVLTEFLAWAEYNDADAADDTQEDQPQGKADEAGPAVDQPPTSHWQALVEMLTLEHAQLSLEVKTR